MSRLILGLGEVGEVAEMIRYYSLDIRSVTVAVDATVCSSPRGGEAVECIRSLVREYGWRLAVGARRVASRLGVPVTTLRLALTPVAEVFSPIAARKGVEEAAEYIVEAAREAEEAARSVGVDYVGGFSAYADQGATRQLEALLRAMKTVLVETERVMGFVNVGSTMLGLSVDSLRRSIEAVVEAAHAAGDPLPGAKFIVTVNVAPDIPFLPAAHHGRGLQPGTVSIAISGPKVAANALKGLPQNAPMERLAEELKRIGFKVSRLGQLMLEKVSEETGLPMGGVDLSLAPTPEPGDSIAAILEAMGVEFGAPGTVAALALLVDSLKKGGVMGVCCVSGYSGAMIPVSEDSGLARAAAEGRLTLAKLVALTSVCSTGVDMVPVPGEEPVERLAALALDTLAVGLVNQKTMGVRLLPAPGRKPGDTVELGGLLGEAPVIGLGPGDPSTFINRGGRIPPPLKRLQWG